MLSLGRHLLSRPQGPLAVKLCKSRVIMSALKGETPGPEKPIKEVVQVERVHSNLYRGCNLIQTERMRACYGGQIASQALVAATKSISDLDSSFLLHSIHCYFVGPTQASSEVVYKVERIKDGKTFCSMSVQALQEGRVTFHCLASFQKNENTGVELDYTRHPMPVVPHPDHEEIEGELKLVDPNVQRRLLLNSRLRIEMRLCVHPETMSKFMVKEPIEPKQAVWLRGMGFTDDDHQNYHRISLIYLSDILLAGMVLRKFPTVKVELMTSLDHSMWFHSPVNADKWYLFVFEAERFNEGRSLSSARVYSEDGTMVATVKQEALVRPKL